MRVKIDKEWKPIILLGGFAEIDNNNLTILVNGAEEINEIDMNEAQGNLEKANNLLAEAITNKEKIEATQNLRRAKAKLQAATVLNN